METTKEIRFTVAGEPRGKERPRVFMNKKTGRSHGVTPEKTVLYENLVRVMYQQAAGGFRFPDDTMLDMRIKACYAVPASAPKKKRLNMLWNILRPVKKPDWDNIGKIVADSLNGIAYKDDSYIVDAQVRKFYSANPRVEVSIRAVEPHEMMEV